MYSPDSASSSNLRSRFTDGSIETASGSQVIVMCFDRLERDLAGAIAAIGDGDHDLTNTLLRHAQDLVAEMVSMLDVDVWEHAPALLSVYDYVLRRLAQANVEKCAAAVEESRRLLGDLGDGFRGAALAVATTATTPVGSGTASTPAHPGAIESASAVERPRLSLQA